MSDLPEIRLKPKKQGTFLARHPWVLAKSIEVPQTPPADGAAVDVVLPDGKWLARGIYNGQSHIRVRLYSWQRDVPLDEAFWRHRLRAAIELRRQIGYDRADGAARLVFSEADGLGGLIVDRYRDHLVVQWTALAMAARRELIVSLLAELLQPRGITWRTDRKIAAAEGMEMAEGAAWGEPLPGRMPLEENGVLFEVELGEGQKTGYYLDQRENHAAAASCLRGRSVLDMFCYVGGFSLTAARAGAQSVLGIDSSQRAVERAQANAALNGLEQVRFEVGEGFRAMEELLAAGRRFGGVVLDPPRFAPSRVALDQALRAYHRLNRLGVQLLGPGQSGRVPADAGRRIAQDAARDPSPATARRSARPPRASLGPRDRVSEVFHLPGGVSARRARPERVTSSADLTCPGRGSILEIDPRHLGQANAVWLGCDGVGSVLGRLLKGLSAGRHLP